MWEREKEYLEWDDLLPNMKVITIRNKNVQTITQFNPNRLFMYMTVNEDGDVHWSNIYAAFLPDKGKWYISKSNEDWYAEDNIPEMPIE